MENSTIMSATLLIISMAVFLTGAAALSPAMAPSEPLAPGPSMAMGPSTSGSDCFNKLVNMSDCLTYVEAGSNLTTPDKKCCPELAGLVDSEPTCLCQFLSQAGNFGITLDLTRAENLPNVCRISTPPLSLCSAIGIPIGAPTSASQGPSASGTVPAESSPSMAPDSGVSPNSDASTIKDLSFFILVGFLSLAVSTIY